MNFRHNPYSEMHRQGSFDGAKKRIEDKENSSKLLGPGHYEIKDKFIKNSHSNVSQFGSQQRRFVSSSNDNEQLPGPGSYINHSQWIENTSEVNKLILDKIRPRKLQTIHKSMNNENPNEDLQALKEAKNRSPSPGSYNPDLFNINFNVKNKNRFHFLDVPFSSKEKRFNASSPNRNKLGPGYYFREKKVKDEQMQPPFKTGDRKFIEPKINNDVGPGQYNQHSYFDWNKKSYNVLYL